MGLINDLWWLAGLAFAAPLAIVGAESAVRGQWLLALLFLGLAVVMLLLPEYVKYRISGSSESFVATIPVVGRFW